MVYHTIQMQRASVNHFAHADSRRAKGKVWKIRHRLQEEGAEEEASAEAQSDIVKD